MEQARVQHDQTLRVIAQGNQAIRSLAIGNKNPQWRDIEDPTKPGTFITVNPDTYNEEAFKKGDRSGVLGGAKTSGLALAGGRESQQNNRIMTGANEAVAVLKNIAELPITAGTGIFGTRGHQTGIFNAGAETLVQKATTQEVQDYRSITAGLQRFLGAIETSGMAVPVAVMNSVDSVIAREGMTNITKLRNMAEIRQIIEKGMEVVITNPRVPPEQKALMQKAVDEAKQAVPFTQSDITRLQRMQKIDPKITLGDLIGQLGKTGITKPAATGVDTTNPLLK
jgi:hypothetical protein